MCFSKRNRTKMTSGRLGKKVNTTNWWHENYMIVHKACSDWSGLLLILPVKLISTQSFKHLALHTTAQKALFSQTGSDTCSYIATEHIRGHWGVKGYSFVLIQFCFGNPCSRVHSYHLSDGNYYMWLMTASRSFTSSSLVLSVIFH